MLYALKQLCLMNPADRRSAQTGACGLKVGRDKFKLTVQSQGVATGERVLGKIENEKIPFERMSDLGMRDKMIESFKEQLDATWQHHPDHGTQGRRSDHHLGHRRQCRRPVGPRFSVVRGQGAS